MARHLYFNNRDEFFRISIDNIVFFEADKNYTFMQLATGQRLAFIFSLQKMQGFLAESLGDDARMFARVGKSHIVNLKLVYNIDISKRVLRLLTPVKGEIFTLKMSQEALRTLRGLYVKGK